MWGVSPANKFQSGPSGSREVPKAIQKVPSSFAVLCLEVQLRRPQGGAWAQNGSLGVLLGGSLGEKSSVNRIKTSPFGSRKIPKVVQKVPSSVAVLCPRGAIEEATGRSLAPKWPFGVLLGGVPGRDFLAIQVQKRSIWKPKNAPSCPNGALKRRCSVL